MNQQQTHSDDYWDTVIEVNLNAQFVLSRELGKRMIERGSGKVIFTASLLTFQGGITVPGYAASKGGIGQLTKALAKRMGWAGCTGQRNCPRVYSYRPIHKHYKIIRCVMTRSWNEFR